VDAHGNQLVERGLQTLVLEFAHKFRTDASDRPAGGAGHNAASWTNVE
jgi:hypothetical protein